MIRFLIITLLASTVLASTFKAGYDFYSRGDFVKAEKALLSAKPKNSAESQQILKFLGISQFMLRKTAAAQASFKRLLQLNPSASIQAQEVLDEKVIAFFQQQKPAAPNRPAPRAQKPLVATKSTTLRINSNVASANVLLDGILAGRVSSLLEVKPGISIVDVTAPGYRTKKLRVTIVANRENTFTVNLDKIQAKPKPAKAPPTKKSTLPKVDSLFDEPEPSSPDMAGRDLQSEFALDSSQPGFARPPIPTQPNYPQAYPTMPSYPPPAQPYYPSPYAYPPPYGYPAMPYQQQPVYPVAPYQPPYQAPYSSPAMPPPATTIPSVDPAPGYDNSGSEEFLPPTRTKKRKNPSPSRRPSSSKKSSSSSQGGSLFIAILPFGAGQFQNGSFFLGSAFAAGEIGALAWWYTNKQDADAAITEFESYKQSGATDAEKADYSKQVEAYVAEKRQNQNIGLIGFGGLYVIGVGEAIINAPEPPKKKTRKSPRYSFTPTSVDRSHDVVAVKPTTVYTLKVGWLPEISQPERQIFGLRARIDF